MSKSVQFFPSILVLLILFFTTSLYSQQKKILDATRISDAPKIDGILDEDIWQTLPTYGNFNMFQPGNEGIIEDAYKTEVKMAYDDKAVYIAAYMYHPNPSEILSQFSQRDNINVQADNFAVALNTYNDGINETRFYVTSAGTVGDSKVTLNRQDFSYNVVFECRVSKDENGWYAEFKIPYNALRFPEVEIQNWSVNFYRRLVKENETHTWSFIKNGEGRETQYNSPIKGVTNIDPPVRLTLFPFAQGVVTNFDGETQTNLSAGLDVKYGLSDSFTLDATLIPDFGQASFDEVSLNLGPFEQTFGENRAFFTEGIDLFQKGRIFFSRRVGGSPSGSVGELNENEIVEENPSRVNLLNALKISGRTKDGLGVGFFNAITEKTFASILDTVGNTKREVLVEPLANYNIFVLDQQFNENSSISIINTNVTRNGNFRDANTSGLVFDLSDKKNTFAVSGRAIVSNVNYSDRLSTGFLSEIDVFKTTGNLRYRVGHDFSNTTFDINDLGISFRNNFNNFAGGISYEIFEPTETFNRYRIGLTARHRRLYKPSVETGNTFRFDSFFSTINRLAFGGDVSYNTTEKDYFEPRIPGRFVIFNDNIGGRLWTSTDFRKKFAFDIGVGYRHFFNDPQRRYFFDFDPRYRFSDKFEMVYSVDLGFTSKGFGYIDNDEVNVFLGQRDITNIENELRASYNFDPFKAIDLRFRNSWSTADYSNNKFFILNDDGTRSPFEYDISENNPNQNFNIWNLDLSFRWRFAPGSEATLLYRNQIFNLDQQATIGYGESLGNLFEQPQQNTLSLRITYFLDYNNVKYSFNKSS